MPAEVRFLNNGYTEVSIFYLSLNQKQEKGF